MLLLVIDRVLARVQLPAPKNSRYQGDYWCNATVIAMQQEQQQDEEQGASVSASLCRHEQPVRIIVQNDDTTMYEEA